MHLYQAIRATFLCGLLLTSSCGVLPDSKEKADTGPTYSAKFVVPNSDAGLQLTESTLELTEYFVDSENGTLDATGRTIKATFEAASSASKAMHALVPGLSPSHAYLVTAPQAGHSEFLPPVGADNAPTDAVTVPVTQSPTLALLVFALIERKVTPFVTGAALSSLAEGYATDPEGTVGAVEKLMQLLTGKGVTLEEIYTFERRKLELAQDMDFDATDSKDWSGALVFYAQEAAREGPDAELKKMIGQPYAVVTGAFPDLPAAVLAGLAEYQIFASVSSDDSEDDTAEKLKQLVATREILEAMERNGASASSLMVPGNFSDDGRIPIDRLVAVAMPSMSSADRTRLEGDYREFMPMSTAAEYPGDSGGGGPSYPSTGGM